MSAFFWALLSCAAVAGAGEAPIPAIEERTAARLRLQHVRIEPAADAVPGACSGLDLPDLVVTLRGEAIDPASIQLDRSPRPTLHALVVDTSRSLGGKLHEVRDAARSYLAGLRPAHDQALLASFDDSVILLEGPTADHGRLIAALDGVRLGASTTLLDGLHHILAELGQHGRRPVLVLLTDGVDTASVHDRDDVRLLVGRLPDLTAFTIGLAVPPGGAAGPPGTASAKRFLQELAAQSNGRYFDAPTPSSIDPIYRRIREMLDNEALLTVIDPDPDAAPGRLRVRSRRSGCRVRLLAGEQQGPDPPSPPPPARSETFPARLPLAPGPALAGELTRSPHPPVEAACVAEGVTPEAIGFAEVTEGRIRGCALDRILETGLLYDPYREGWLAANAWPRLLVRPFEIAVPPVDELPSHPWQVLDRLAAHALAIRDEPVEVDWSKRPARLHARPYRDHPGLWHGTTFLDLRFELGRALTLREDYRDWAHARLCADGERELAGLAELYRGRARDRTDRELLDAARLSREGSRIRERIDSPSAADLTRYLAAWHGDIPAYELFVRWEQERIDAWLGGPESGDRAPAFLEGWRELREVFRAPSYARLLALLAPIRDPSSDRVGYWRVVLPRPAWLQRRVQGHRHHPDWSDLPLDLVPDLPLGFWTLTEALAPREELIDRLRQRGYRTRRLTYELLGKPRKQDPLRAFERCRVRLVLSPPAEPLARLEITAELTLERSTGEPRLESIDLEPIGDPGLRAPPP